MSCQHYFSSVFVTFILFYIPAKSFFITISFLYLFPGWKFTHSLALSSIPPPFYLACLSTYLTPHLFFHSPVVSFPDSPTDNITCLALFFPLNPVATFFFCFSFIFFQHLSNISLEIQILFLFTIFCFIFFSFFYIYLQLAFPFC